MKRNRSRLHEPGRSFGLGLVIAAAAIAGASCSSVLNIEDWKDPLASSGPGATTGGGAPGGGGASSTTVGSVTVGAGGFGGGATATCDSCIADKCDVCGDDPQCRAYRQCMPSPETCCQAHPELGFANGTSQRMWDCMIEKCADTCFPNATCRDCFKDGLETDLDCGGDACQPCEEGRACTNDADCRHDATMQLSCVKGTCG